MIVPVPMPFTWRGVSVAAAESLHGRPARATVFWPRMLTTAARACRTASTTGVMRSGRNLVPAGTLERIRVDEWPPPRRRNAAQREASAEASTAGARWVGHQRRCRAGSIGWLNAERAEGGASETGRPRLRSGRSATRAMQARSARRYYRLKRHNAGTYSRPSFTRQPKREACQQSVQ